MIKTKFCDNIDHVSWGPRLFVTTYFSTGTCTGNFEVGAHLGAWFTDQAGVGSLTGMRLRRRKHPTSLTLCIHQQQQAAAVPLEYHDTVS